MQTPATLSSFTTRARCRELGERTVAGSPGLEDQVGFRIGVFSDERTLAQVTIRLPGAP